MLLKIYSYLIEPLFVLIVHFKRTLTLYHSALSPISSLMHYALLSQSLILDSVSKSSYLGWFPLIFSQIQSAFLILGKYN